MDEVGGGGGGGDEIEARSLLSTSIPEPEPLTTPEVDWTGKKLTLDPPAPLE